MANTFTVTEHISLGSKRAVVGTLTMTDGDAGSSANAGFNRIIFAVDNSSTQAKISHTGGSIIACTAASAATYQVFIVGE